MLMLVVETNINTNSRAGNIQLFFSPVDFDIIKENVRYLPINVVRVVKYVYRGNKNILLTQ